jgi:two-component system OmpR family response regulator
MRVLLVEDEVRLAQAIARGLIAEGFTVDIEHDGVDGSGGRARGGTTPSCSTCCSRVSTGT